MQIDLLFFEDCPSWRQAMENLMAALELEGLQADIHLVEVNDNTASASLKFLGSPSFQVNGADLWPEERLSYTLSCRVYPTPGGLLGAPSVDMLRQKLRNLVLSESE